MQYGGFDHLGEHHATILRSLGGFGFRRLATISGSLKERKSLKLMVLALLGATPFILVAMPTDSHDTMKKALLYIAFAGFALHGITELIMRGYFYEKKSKAILIANDFGFAIMIICFGTLMAAWGPAALFIKL